MRPTLQRRLLLLVLTVFAFGWIAAAAAMWQGARHELDELLDGHLAQAAALLVAQSTRELEEEREVEAPPLHRYAPRVAFQVFHEGRLVLRSAGAPAQPMNTVQGFATVQRDGVAWRVFSTHGAKTDVDVHVAEQSASRGEILTAILGGALAPMALALPLLALAIWWAVSAGLAPLRRLTSVLAARAPDASDALDTSGMPAEAAAIADALNALFARIDALIGAERRFTADAAHELRTPIAAIRAQAQVALGAAVDDPVRGRALALAIEGCDRAGRMIDQLLTLARLDARDLPPLASVDLVQAAREVVADLAPRALARRQQIELTGAQACPVLANPTLLAILVRNLVDNAVRYSPDGAAIAADIAVQDESFTLTVSDNGPGMAEDALARLGERFFRAEQGGQSGSGLGWSIVRRIAQVHGFEVQPALRDGGGLSVTVRGPRAPSIP
ncbi:MAG TPA: ATP-binding protein [Telluria sp.]|nr:ATP-binding protein [Telluria sp.]